MCGGERACGVGGRSVAREQQGLTAASTEILGAAVASAAGFRHPFFSPKALERRRSTPDGLQRFLPNIFESEAGNNFRGVTGKNFAGWIDEHQSPSPAAHAGFGKARVVIGDDGIDADASGEVLFGGGDGFDSPIQLLACGQERGAILQSPAVVLGVGDLHALWSELLDERDHLFKVIDVLAMDDEINGERDLVTADDA